MKMTVNSRVERTGFRLSKFMKILLWYPPRGLAGMLELICDQSYTWAGLPADKSPYRNHGQAINTGGGYDGVEPGSGVINFPDPNSRVRIPVGQAWRPLTVLKIDVVAKVDPMARFRSVLVAGDGSFRFGILEGALEAEFHSTTGNHSYIRAADSYSPDHEYHPVPADKWVKLGFYHDGFAHMRLFMDDELVAETLVAEPIPAVQGLGVSIGNGIDEDDRQFPGEIDELRIWRLDPKNLKREFLSRPYTHKTARCWQRYFESAMQWAKRHPDQPEELVREIGTWRNGLSRALLLLPDDEQAKAQAILIAFTDLWSAGNIAGPEMEQVLCDWIALLTARGLDPGRGPGNDLLSHIRAALKKEIDTLLKCDPKFAAFLTLLHNAEENCAREPEGS
jgi:hypothetical protein